MRSGSQCCMPTRFKYGFMTWVTSPIKLWSPATYHFFQARKQKGFSIFRHGIKTFENDIDFFIIVNSWHILCCLGAFESTNETKRLTTQCHLYLDPPPIRFARQDLSQFSRLTLKPLSIVLHWKFCQYCMAIKLRNNLVIEKSPRNKYSGIYSLVIVTNHDKIAHTKIQIGLQRL